MNSPDLANVLAQPCPCGTGASLADCCAPLHQGARLPENAEALMRSRYTAYVLGKIDYIVASTVPAQQALLDVAAIEQWSRHTAWAGLTVHQHRPRIGKHHAQVHFSAAFDTAQGRQQHDEHSAFVCINGRWYVLDPTVALPGLKQPCICGSGKKFKHCCAAVLV